HPVRYVSTMTIRVAPTPPSTDKTAKKTPSTTVPLVVPSPAAKLASNPATERAALAASKLPAGEEKRISLRARPNATADLLSLVVSAPTRTEATTVAKNWSDQFIVARKLDAARAVTREQGALYTKTKTLHDELVTVDQKLGKLLP